MTSFIWFKSCSASVNWSDGMSWLRLLADFRPTAKLTVPGQHLAFRRASRRPQEEEESEGKIESVE